MNLTQNNEKLKETAQLNAFLESIVPMGARRRGQLLEQHMSEYDAEQIRNIQAPTFVMHARDDTLVSFEQGEFSARNIPGAQLIPVEKGGHLALMMEMNGEMLKNTWQSFRGWPLVVQIVVGLLVLPVALGLWIWQTSWPIWLRLILVVGLGWVAIYLFFPRKTRSQAEASSPKS